jgi:multiple sugar transport system ATP-binding protein
LKRLHQRLKTTTIYVTHDQEEAMTLGDRIVVMKDGLIQQADTPLKTYNHPNNRFVAGFIGMPPMNFFDGTIKQQDGQMVFEEGRLENAKVAGGRADGNGKPRSDEPVVMVGELTLPGNGFRLPVPDHHRARLAGAVGKHVVMGIRPEHFHMRPVESSGHAPLKVQLNVVEPLGNDMDLYMATTLHPHVVGRVEAQAGLEMNTQATVFVDLRKVHFFEPGATGMNLSLANEPAHAIA